MSTTTWYISFLWFLYIQGSIHALPATPPPGPASQSLSASHARHRRDTETFKLNEKEYNAKPIPLHEQGYYSDSYVITGGFQVGEKRVPAILKRVKEKGAEDEDSRTRREIGFLKRDSVDLYLYHEWSKTMDKTGSYDVSIVVRDIGALDPPFKPFYKWYEEDKTMDTVDSLRNARENIKNTLQWFREEENLLYNDIKPENIFLRKAALQSLGMKREINSSVQVMPIDWGPPGKYAGVMDIAAEDDDYRSEILPMHTALVHKRLEKNFGVDALYANLKKHDLALREQDITNKEFKGKTYNLLPIIEASPQDHTNTYVIIGGFNNNRHALMRIIKKDRKSEWEAAIQEMKTVRRFHSQDRDRLTEV